MINTASFSSAQLRLRKDTVLVRPDKQDIAQQQSGIYLAPEKLRPIDGHWSTVVAVPEELYSFKRNCKTCERPMEQYDDEIKVGQRVLLDSEHAGDQIMVDGAEHRLVRVAELLAVCDE